MAGTSPGTVTAEGFTGAVGTAGVPTAGRRSAWLSLPPVLLTVLEPPDPVSPFTLFKGTASAPPESPVEQTELQSQPVSAFAEASARLDGTDTSVEVVEDGCSLEVSVEDAVTGESQSHPRPVQKSRTARLEGMLMLDKDDIVLQTLLQSLEVSMLSSPATERLNSPIASPSVVEVVVETVVVSGVGVADDEVVETVVDTAEVGAATNVVADDGLGP